MNTTLYLSEYTLVTRHHSSLLDQLVYYKGKSFCALLIFVQKTANILQEPDDDVFVNRLELFYAFADQSQHKSRQNEPVLSELYDKVHISNPVIKEEVDCSSSSSLEVFVVCLKLRGQSLSNLVSVLLIKISHDPADILDCQVVVSSKLNYVCNQQLPSLSCVDFTELDSQSVSSRN